MITETCGNGCSCYRHHTTEGYHYCGAMGKPVAEHQTCLIPVEDEEIPITLVVDHWKNKRDYKVEHYSEESDANFHSGCTYEGTIKMPWYLKAELLSGMKKAFPVFLMKLR